MAYIVFVNPLILADAGMDRGAVFVATCLASAFATLLMALFANYPLALAPGMGMNAYFAYSVVKGLHYTWEVALGAVFLSGVLFLIISVTPIRAWIVDAIPRSQKMAISAGIGLFLGIIALKDAGIITANPETLVTLGDLKAPAALLAAAGFLVMVALERRAVPGAIIVAVPGTAADILCRSRRFSGIVGTAQSLGPPSSRSTARRPRYRVATVVFVFLFVDLFDNTGTLIGVAHRAGLLEGTAGCRGRALRLRRLAGGDGRRPPRHLDRDELHRECGRGQSRRPHRAHRRHRRGAVPVDPVPRAARPVGAGLRDRAGTPLRRLPDDAGPHGDRLGRRHRIRPGRRHRIDDAADVLDRQRHRPRLHQLAAVKLLSGRFEASPQCRARRVLSNMILLTKTARAAHRRRPPSRAAAWRRPAEVRPTSDHARGPVQHHRTAISPPGSPFAGRPVLDAFAGTGAFGLKSRGASEAPS
jgi:hypothetical protein